MFYLSLSLLAYINTYCFNFEKKKEQKESIIIASERKRKKSKNYGKTE